jgi:CRISPR-associated protein Csm1
MAELNKKEDIQRQIVYLAALLHDIGKFYKGKLGTSNNEKDYTLLFLEDQITKNILENWKVNDVSLLDQLKNALSPNSEINTLINKIKKFSLGDQKNDKEDVSLSPIFEEINNTSQVNYKYSLQPLSLDENVIFPKQLNGKEQNSQQWKKLVEDFLLEFAKIPTGSLEGFTETLLFLLKKYTSYIAAGSTIKGISLYEHLKITAALTQSYFDYNQHSEQKNNEPFLLACGDVSGIQKFIYEIYSRKAAKSLKGRSFYLQLLVETIIQKIQEHESIKVPLGNVVYSSGGKFYIILPNLNKVKEALSEIEKDIERNIFDVHKGALYVCFGNVSFGFDDNQVILSSEFSSQKSDLGQLWRILSEKTAEKKKTKFKDLIVEDFERFFSKTGIGTGSDLEGKITLCAVTGEEIPKKPEYLLDQEEGVYVDIPVKKQVTLGEKLKEADYFISYKDIANEEISNNENIQPIKLGINYFMFNQKYLTDDKAEFRKISTSGVARVKRINDLNFLRINKLEGDKCAYGFSFYGGNRQAMVGNRYKYFEEMAGEGDPIIKYAKLGILRMDVDFLGQIFIKGLPQNKKTFAAYAALSNQLDLFFSGYLNTLRDSTKYKDWVNILYSGGDDVFALGRWDLLIEFAAEIRNKFRQFIGNREDISISAGIILVDPKFPISKAADLAGEAEKLAKKYKNETLVVKEKNSITLFGEAVSWEREFDEVVRLKNVFLKLNTNNLITSGFLQKLLEFQFVKNRHRQLVTKSEKSDLSYKWNSAYVIARFMEKFKNKEIDSELKMLMDKLKKELLAGEDFKNDRYYDICAVAARWTMLKIRMNK